MTAQKKNASYKKGLWAEYYCLFFLFLCGYRVLKHRYKTHLGEIDLIAIHKNTVVFLEIKARKAVEDGLYAVHPTAQKRIRNAAQSFLSQHPHYAEKDMRFDVMVVTKFYRCPLWQKNAW